MATTEDIILQVQLDMKRAKASLQKLREEVKGTADTTNELGGQGGALQKLTQMNTKTIFSISNLAQTFQLTQGPANQMKFVLGQIFDQFTLMGPQGLLIGGAVAGLGLLIRKFRQTGEVAKDTSKEIRQIQMASASMAVSINAEFASLDVIENIKKQFAPGPLRDFEIRLAKLRTELQLQEKAAATSEKSYEALKEVVRQTENDLARLTKDEQAQAPAIQKRLEQQQKLLEERKGLLDELNPKRRVRIELIKNELGLLEAQRSNAVKANDIAKKEAALKEKSNELKREGLKLDRGKDGAGAGKPATEADKFREEMAEAFAIQDEIRSMEEEERQRQLDAKKAHDKKMLQEQKKADEEAKRQLKKTIAEQQAIHGAAMGFGIDLIQAGGEMMIEGEKNIGQRLGALFLRRTGEMLINDGQARILMGVAANATAPGSGVGMMAAGAAEIAAGIGMGAAASAITQNIQTSQGGGGGGGAASMAERAGIASDGERTTSAGATMGGTTKEGGGPTVINISYGVGGPNPEDAAQAVLNALELGNRRGMRGRA